MVQQQQKPWFIKRMPVDIIRRVRMMAAYRGIPMYKMVEALLRAELGREEGRLGLYTKKRVG